MTGALLALALAGTPALAAPPPLAQEEWETPPWEEDEEQVKRLFLSVWGGGAFGLAGDGTSGDVYSAEVAWAFGHLDLGLAGYAYRDLSPDVAWTRVAMLRLTQRFPMRSGVEAAFGLGIGAARDTDWNAWFQVALGVRVPLGPLFLGGELAFERGDLLRLSAGLGLAF